MNDLVEELSQLEKNSMRRSLRVVEETQSARITLAGKSLMNFSSNNYLGLARHPRVVEAVQEVMQHWGAGATSSRLISGTSIIHRDLELALAAFVKKENALVFPAGYMANLAVVTSLAGPGDAIVMDRLCHASLVDAAHLSGARLFVFTHADAQDAEKALERTRSHRRRLLLTESLFSMNGDFAPLKNLLSLAHAHDAISIVDDAHALGVWDTEAPEADIVVGTLSKSLGSQGGFVAGSHELIDTLVNRARAFIFTTGLSPMCVAAAQAALSILQENTAPRARVQKLSSQLRDGLRRLGFDILGSESQIVPVLLGEAEEALRCANRLLEAGIFAPAIRPPTVHAHHCRIRFSITADHIEEDIDHLLKMLNTFPSPLRGRGSG